MDNFKDKLLSELDVPNKEPEPQAPIDRTLDMDYNPADDVDSDVEEAKPARWWWNAKDLKPASGEGDGEHQEPADKAAVLNETGALSSMDNLGGDSA